MTDLEGYRELLENELQGFLKEQESGGSLLEPVIHMLSNGGKRLRPCLVLMGCEMMGEDPQKALKPALGIEVFHNFTLMHDDLMDQAPIRRGKATVHEQWGESAAILSGDAMFVKAYELLMSLEDKSVMSEVLNLFNQIALEVCEGQQADMDFETREKVEIPEYLSMIEAKTAALLDGSLRIGAMIGHAPEEELQKLKKLGRSLGIAFQLKDDLLDVYGSEETFGKKVGGDIRSNKKTYLYLKALEKANPEQRKLLKSYFHNSASDEETKVQEIMALFQQLSIEEECTRMIHQYQEAADQALESLNIPESGKESLKALGGMLMVREQ